MNCSMQDENDKRTNGFRNNPYLDVLLKELKELLKPIQDVKQKDFKAPKWPVGLIVGNPRSGSTVLLQWIASLNVFAYPSNILARFAYSPYLGALIQRMLFDPKYEYHGAFEDIKSNINYDSTLGKSKGALATNEFHHFIRNYVPNYEPKHLNCDELVKTDPDGLRRGFASIEYVFEKPFITKGSMIQFNIDYFYKKIPEFIFINLKRDAKFIMQSLIIAREKYYGTHKEWWSFKPFEYYFLKDMDIYHQVAGQVYYTEKAITEGLCCVPENRKIFINYEEFCKSPKKFFIILSEKYEKLGFKISNSYTGPGFFKCRNEERLPKNDLIKLESAYKYFSKNDSITTNK